MTRMGPGGVGRAAVPVVQDSAARVEASVSCEERREWTVDRRVGEGWESERIGVMTDQHMRVLLGLCTSGDGGICKHTH